MYTHLRVCAHDVPDYLGKGSITSPFGIGRNLPNEVFTGKTPLKCIPPKVVTTA